MIVTPAALAAIYYSFYGLYQRGYARIAPWTERIATVVPSTGAENHYPWMEQIPRLREWIGERAVQNLSARSYVLANKDFELTLELDRNTIEDDNFGVFAPTVEMMGWQAAKWPDDQMVKVLQAGITSLCFDGQFYFDTDHPVNMDDPASATYANRYTSTALNATNYNTVRAAMMSVNAADGKPLRVNPNLLVVPPQLEVTARQILKADFIAPTGAFGGNAAGGIQSNVLQGSADLLVAPDLSNEPGNWYLLDTSMPIKPFIWQLRKAPDFVSLTNPTDENLFWRKKFVYGVDSRGNAGYGLPFLAARAEA